MTQVPNIAGNNIRRIRKERGWSQADVAERLGGGTHFTTVAKIERSQRRLTQDWILRFATALEVSPAEVMDGETPFTALRMVPVIGRIAAGNWKEAVQDPQGWVPAVGGGPNAFGLIPDGDSMDLVVAAGATIIVDPDQRDLNDGSIYAVMNSDGETTFKRFRTNPMRLEPCSTNPSHRPIPIGHEPFTIVGRITAQIAPM